MASARAASSPSLARLKSWVISPGDSSGTKKLLHAETRVMIANQSLQFASHCILFGLLGRFHRASVETAGAFTITQIRLAGIATQASQEQITGGNFPMQPYIPPERLGDPIQISLRPIHQIV